MICFSPRKSQMAVWYVLIIEGSDSSGRTTLQKQESCQRRSKSKSAMINHVRGHLPRPTPADAMVNKRCHGLRVTTVKSRTVIYLYQGNMASIAVRILENGRHSLSLKPILDKVLLYRNHRIDMITANLSRLSSTMR